MQKGSDAVCTFTWFAQPLRGEDAGREGGQDMAAAGDEGGEGKGDGPAGGQEAGAGGRGHVVGEVPQQQQMGEAEMKRSAALRGAQSQDLAVSPESLCKFFGRWATARRGAQRGAALNRSGWKCRVESI